MRKRNKGRSFKVFPLRRAAYIRYGELESHIREDNPELHRIEESEEETDEK